MSKTFQAYSYENAIPVNTPLFDVTTKEFTPAAEVSEHQVHELLDAITLGVEAGVVLKTDWLKQIFGTDRSFGLWLVGLRHISKFMRVNDRNWYALATIADVADKKGTDCWTLEKLADALEQAAKKTGQL